MFLQHCLPSRLTPFSRHIKRERCNEHIYSHIHIYIGNIFPKKSCLPCLLCFIAIVLNSQNLSRPRSQTKFVISLEYKFSLNKFIPFWPKYRNYCIESEVMLLPLSISRSAEFTHHTLISSIHIYQNINIWHGLTGPSFGVFPYIAMVGSVS